MIAPKLALIGDEAAPYLDRARESGRGGLVDEPGAQTRAVKVLEAECNSPSRLEAGMLAWFVAIVGSGLCALTVWDGLNPVVRVLAVVAGVLAIGWSAWFGRKVWEAGRSVVHAFVHWVTPKTASGQRSNVVADVVQTRTFVLGSAPRMFRLVIAVCCALGALILLINLAAGSRQPFDATSLADGQRPAMVIFGLLGGLACGVAAGVTFGGIVRANTAQAQRDPIWRWIRANVFGAAPTPAIDDGDRHKPEPRVGAPGRLVGGVLATLCGLIAAFLFAGSQDPSTEASAALAGAGWVFAIIAGAVAVPVWWRGRRAIRAYQAANPNGSEGLSAWRRPLVGRSICAVVAALLVAILIVVLIATVVDTDLFGTEETWPVVWVSLSLVTLFVAMSVVVSGLAQLRRRGGRPRG